MFTDLEHSEPKNLRESHSYPVCSGARVRREEFGLLFYNTRNTRLTFVRSGDLLQIENLPGGEKMIAFSNESSDRRKFKKILDSLVNKGLIFEA